MMFLGFFGFFLFYRWKKENTKNKNHCRDWELLLLSDYYYYCFLRWLKPLCYEISLLSSLYITCHIHRSVFLSQTNRRRVYIKACKGSSYEINQWKISLFSKLITVRIFNFLFEKFKLQSQVLFDNNSVWVGCRTPCWT